MGITFEKMASFRINGEESLKYNIFMENPPDITIPITEKELEKIPGKNGEIVFDTGTFKNIPKKYNVAIGSRNYNFSLHNAVSRAAMWLNQNNKLIRLEDRYEGYESFGGLPLYYRYASLTKPIDITNVMNQAGKFTIEFSCEPFKYFKMGESIYQYTISSTFEDMHDSPIPSGVLNWQTLMITNPSIIPAEPVITIKNDWSKSHILLNINDDVFAIGYHVPEDSPIYTKQLPITIDSRNKIVYAKDNETNILYDAHLYLYKEKISNMYPILKGRNNTIQYINVVHSAINPEIKPVIYLKNNWRTV